jgi:ribose 1,5-bisphosphokinase
MACLFYVVGASGVGKDSLLQYAKLNLPLHSKYIFTHRYITRAANAGGENHIELTNEEFIIRKQAGLFLFDWESHNNYYGIGIEVLQWIEAGFNVVLNGSRAHLENAKIIYPNLIDILIDANPEIIAQRLLKRKRESESEIYLRIQRNTLIESKNRFKHIILNNTMIAEAGNDLLNALILDLL